MNQSEVKKEPPIIETRLGKIFTTAKTTVEALSDVNLTIERGEIFGIIGLSGAGKSTLIRCLNLLEKPTSGAVYFKGRDLAELSKRDLLRERQNIGMIFQSFNLLEQRNALENICFPLEIAGKRNIAKQRARELLDLVGIPDKANAYPSELSGGQQQRVAIARALATEPEVLLCDEATSALDPTTTESILALLKEINERLNVTIVIITHQMEVVNKTCDRVAVMDQSRVVSRRRPGGIHEPTRRWHVSSCAAERTRAPIAQQTDDPADFDSRSSTNRSSRILSWHVRHRSTSSTRTVKIFMGQHTDRWGFKFRTLGASEKDPCVPESNALITNWACHRTNTERKVKSVTTQQLVDLLVEGIRQTAYMTLISTLMAYAIGLPLGVLTVTDVWVSHRTPG